MNIELDEKALQVLKSVFEWTDFDRNGSISKEDLKKTANLSSESEVNEIFRALKKGSGINSASDITYEEFCKGIMDFPFLLTQFKNEFVTKPLEINVETNEDQYEDINMETQEHQRDSELSFIIPGLKDTISIYYKLLKNKEIVQSNDKEELLETLRIALEKVKKTFRHEGETFMWLVNGGIELYLLVRDITRFNEEIITEYKAEIIEKDDLIYSLNEKCEFLADENDKLLYQLGAFENKAAKIEHKHEETLVEKKSLEEKLEKAEDSERKFREELKKIENVIFSKEIEISKLEKELRKLNSYKTIQEMRGTNCKTTIECKQNKENPVNSRQSMPINHLIPTKFIASPKNDFKAQFFASQLKFKTEKVKESELENVKLERLLQVYDREVQKLKEENKMLLEKLQVKNIEKFRVEVDSEGHSVIPSLLEELMMIKDGTTIIGGSYENKSEQHIEKKIDKEVQASPVVKEEASQIKLGNLGIANSRGCFSCI